MPESRAPQVLLSPVVVCGGYTSFSLRYQLKLQATDCPNFNSTFALSLILSFARPSSRSRGEGLCRLCRSSAERREAFAGAGGQTRHCQQPHRSHRKKHVFLTETRLYFIHGFEGHWQKKLTGLDRYTGVCMYNINSTDTKVEQYDINKEAHSIPSDPVCTCSNTSGPMVFHVGLPPIRTSLNFASSSERR